MRLFFIATFCVATVWGQGGGGVQFRDWAAPVPTGKPAIACGELLIEAKRQVKHGEWRPWIEANCKVPARTARHYMALARRRKRLFVLTRLSRAGAHKFTVIGGGPLWCVFRTKAGHERAARNVPPPDSCTLAKSRFVQSLRR